MKANNKFKRFHETFLSKEKSLHLFFILNKKINIIYVAIYNLLLS